MSALIVSLYLLSFAAAQTGTISAGLPSASGYPSAPGNITACPQSVDSLCAYEGQTTFCYDASSVLYTVTCGMSFDGEVIEPNSANNEEEEEVKVKRDDYFAFPYVSLADCTSACDERGSCLAVNILNGGSCEMVDTITGITSPASGTVAAYKGYWGYNSTIPGGPPVGNVTIPANTTSPTDDTTTATSSLSSSTTTSEVDSSTSSSSLTPPASAGLPSVSANDTTAIVGPTAFPSTTYPAIIPSGVRPSGGFGFPSGSIIPIPPAATGIPGVADEIPPSGFPSAGSFPSCSSVTCSLAGTPSTPFCHNMNMQLYTIKCAVTFLGATMLTIPQWGNAMLETCADACDSVADCQAVNFDGQERSCTLVSGVTGVNFGATNIVGAWRGYWPSAQLQVSGTAPSGTAPLGTVPVGTAPAGTAPISSKVPLSTGTTTSSSVPLGTAGISGFPTLSINSSSIAAGPTGTGGFPGTFPTGGFPNPSVGVGNGSYPSCSETACENAAGTAYCTDSSGQVYTLNCGMRFLGTSGLNSSAASLAVCEAACDGLPRCLAFNYGFGQCEYMYTVTGIDYPANGYVAAWRGAWQGGAPPQGGSTGTSGLPINSASSTSTASVPLGTGSISASTVATSGFPSISVNSTAAVGPTGFVPTGVSSGFPGTTGRPSNTSYNSCSARACSSYGAVYCPDNQSQLYSINCGLMFKGGISNTAVSATGLAGCADVCDASASCLAYNYALANSTCSFLLAVTGIDYPAPGYLAAWKGYWAGGAPPSVSSGILVNSANSMSTISMPIGTGISASPTQSASSTSSSTSLSSILTTSTVTLGSATSGLPSVSFNSSSFPVGPAGFIPTGHLPMPTGYPSNVSSCARDSCESGQTYCLDSQGQLYTLNCGLKFSGLSYHESASSLGECEKTCDSQPRCLGVNFNGQQCQVVTLVTGMEYPAPGWTAAWKGVWAGGAPVAPSSGVPVNSANATATSSIPLGTGSISFSTSSSSSSSSTSSSSTSSVVMPLGTATSGFPSVSANSSFPVGPTGFPSRPTSFPSPPTNGSYASCAQTSCSNSTQAATYCTNAEGQLYAVNCGIRFTGMVSSTSDLVAGLEDCAEHCDSLPQCLGLNFDGAQCEYLSSVTGVQYPAPGWTAAWRGFWAGSAPSNRTIPSGNGTVSGGNTTSPTQSVNSTSASSTASITSSTASVPASSGFPVPSPNSTSSYSTSVPISTGAPSAPSSPYPLCPSTGCAEPYCVDEAGQLYSVTCGSTFQGSFISVTKTRVKRDINSPTVLDCEAICDATSACVALNYDGSCSYLSAVTGIASVNGSVAIWKGYWGYNSTIPGGFPGNGTFSVNGTISELNVTTSFVLSTTVSSSSSSISSSSASSTASTTTPSVSVPASSGFPAPSTNSSSILPSPTGTPSNGTHELCSGSCAAAYQQSFCADEAGKVYTTTCGILFDGTTTGEQGGSTLLDCESECDSESSCIALNFDGFQCAFLSAVTGIEPKNGSVAAWKGVWYGGAPTNGSAPFPIPTNGSIPISGHLPSPSANSTTSSSPVAPVTTSASTTSSSSSRSSSTSSSVSSTTSFASVTTSSASSTSSVIITTGTPAPGNGSWPSNGTHASCSTVHCAAPYQQSFCSDEAGQLYTITCGVAFDGTYLNISSYPSLLECEASCDSLSVCIALNYDGSSCTFLSTVTGTEAKNGSVAAWKGLWYGGVPIKSSGFPLPPIGTPPTPANETSTSSTPVKPITASVSSTSSSLISISTSIESTTSSLSSSSSVSSSTVSTTSVSTSSLVPISTGTPGLPSGNGSYPTNGTITSCDTPESTLCAAGYGLGRSTFCKDTNKQVYTVTCGIQFTGPLLSNMSASSLAACEHQCDVSAKCVALNYIDDSICSLVSSIYGVVNASDSIAAYRGIWAGSAPNGTASGNETSPGVPSTSAPVQTFSLPQSTTSSTASLSPSTVTDGASTSSLSTSSASSSTSISPASSSVASSSSTSTASVSTDSASSSPTSSSTVSATLSAPTTTATHTDSAYPLCSMSPTVCASSNATFCSDDAGQRWTVTCNAAFNGTVISEAASYKRQATAISLLSCEALCESSADCVAINLDESSCTMLSSVSGISTVEGSLAAYKGSWLTNSTVPVISPARSQSSSSTVSLSTTTSALSSSTVSTSTASSTLSSSTSSPTSSASSTTSLSSSSLSSSTQSSSVSSTTSSVASATTPSTTSTSSTLSSTHSLSTIHHTTSSSHSSSRSSTHSSTRGSTSSAHSTSRKASTTSKATTTKKVSSSTKKVSTTSKPTSSKHSSTTTHKTTPSTKREPTPQKSTPSKPKTTSPSKHVTTSTHKASTSSSTHKLSTSSSTKHSTTSSSHSTSHSASHSTSRATSSTATSSASSSHSSSTPASPVMSSASYGGAQTTSSSISSSSPVDAVTASTNSVSRSLVTSTPTSSASLTTLSTLTSSSSSSKPATTSTTPPATTSSKPATSSTSATATPTAPSTPGGYGGNSGNGNNSKSAAISQLINFLSNLFGKKQQERVPHGPPNIGRFGERQW